MPLSPLPLEMQMGKPGQTEGRWHRHALPGSTDMVGKREAGAEPSGTCRDLELLFWWYLSCFSHVTPGSRALVHTAQRQHAGHTAFGINPGAVLHLQNFCKRSPGGVWLPLSCTSTSSLSHWPFYNFVLWNLIHKAEFWYIGSSENRGNHDSRNISAPNPFPHRASVLIQKDCF